MRIDFISSFLLGGGAERVLVLLANFFASKGHQVTIITFNDGESFQIDERVKRVRLHSGRAKNHTIRTLSNLIFHYRKKANRPDVAISFICRMNFASIIATKIFSIKIIASEHSHHLRKVDKITQFTWNFLYRMANAITVLTGFDKPFFEKKGAKVVIMPNPTSFKPLTENTTDRKKIILAVGNLDRYHIKGFDNLIKLISPILKEHPDWNLKIVGKADRELEVLENMVREEKLAEQIVFTGFRTDISELMCESAIFVLSSRYEGLPMVLLEAMSQGMACIAFDCTTGPAEIISHEINGLLIEDQNMAAMQAGLVRLMNDDALREKLSGAGTESLGRYSIENVSGLWEELFQEIA